MTEEQLVAELVSDRPELKTVVPSLWAAFDLLLDSFSKGGKLLVCGNGGSAADCGHIAGELMKSFRRSRRFSPGEQEQLQTAKRGNFLASKLEPGLPVIDLTAQGPLLTAIANDISADLVFAQQVFVLGKKPDVVFGFTTSGNSQNVVLALETAQAKGLDTISFVGEAGGRAEEVSTVCLRAPRQETAKIQQLHLCCYHTLCAMLEAAFF